MKIEGSVAVITGGASGLGEATARAFVAKGGKAVLLDMNEERGEAVAKELGDAVRFVKTDVTDEAQVNAALDVAESLGTLSSAEFEVI